MCRWVIRVSKVLVVVGRCNCMYETDNVVLMNAWDSFDELTPMGRKKFKKLVMSDFIMFSLVKGERNVRIGKTTPDDVICLRQFLYCV